MDSKYILQKEFYNYFRSLGEETGQWYLDLKNGAGSCGAGVAPSSPDVTMSMKDVDFQKMFTGNLNQGLLQPGHITRSKNFKMPFFQRYFIFLPVGNSKWSGTSPKKFF